MTFPPTPALFGQRDVRIADLTTRRNDTLLNAYAWMRLARDSDNRILELFRQGLIRGTVTGGQGNEPLAVAAALVADKNTDVVSFSHRGLGGHIVWSGHLGDHLCQYLANSGSPTRAREGNIHHGDPSHRSLPMISHLGAMLSTVVGATDSQRRLGKPAIGFAFFGDGASSTGDTHESLNLAALLSVPVLFIIENNGYAYSTPVAEQFNAPSLWERARGYGLDGRALDCSDPTEVLRVLAEAAERVRNTGRAYVIEARTFRLRGHAAYDTCDYLAPGELDAIQAADPLPKFRASLVAAGLETRVEALESETRAFLESTLSAALPLPPASPVGMADDLYAPSTQINWAPTPAQPEKLTMAQALNRGLRKLLAEQSATLVMGQDIATYGGAFKVTEGLLHDFGRPRVLNTPLCESSMVGYAIGLANNGHRPVVEFQFADFVTEAATQVLLNAATYHFRSGQPCPLVFRLPCGGGLTFGSFHSQELESALLAFPGLKALYPSTPQDAFNALLAAYEDSNPVLLFEHKALYRRGKHPVAFDADFRSIWQAAHLLQGDYATVVSYGEMVHHAAAACAYFRDEYDTTFDLFDLRALAPLRLDAIAASLRRTGRLIVIHEGRRTHGFGAELVARLTEKEFTAFKSAPLRIASLDLPVPFAPELESAFRPNQESIIEAIANWMG